MTPEQKGQYYFTPDSSGTFRVQKPHGIPSFDQRIREKISKVKEGLGIATKPRVLKPEDFCWDPETYEEMSLLHDALLNDLREKGILDVIARVTNVSQDEWYDHEKPPTYDIPSKKTDNAWDVDVVGPTFDYHERPNPKGSRWNGTCSTVYSVPRNYMIIQLQIGEEWNDRLVNIRYGRERILNIQGAESSDIDLNKIDSKYLVQEHLRDAMSKPYNPYYETKDGYLSPAAFQRHAHDHFQRQIASYSAMAGSSR